MTEAASVHENFADDGSGFRGRRKSATSRRYAAKLNRRRARAFPSLHYPMTSHPRVTTFGVIKPMNTYLYLSSSYGLEEKLLVYKAAVLQPF